MIAEKSKKTIMPHSELKNLKKSNIEEAKKRASELLKNTNFETYDDLKKKDLTFSLGIFTQKLKMLCLKVGKTNKGKYSFYIVSREFSEVDHVINWKGD